MKRPQAWTLAQGWGRSGYPSESLCVGNACRAKFRLGPSFLWSIHQVRPVDSEPQPRGCDDQLPNSVGLPAGELRTAKQVAFAISSSGPGGQYLWQLTYSKGG